MATDVSLEKAQALHNEAVDANRREGVVEYRVGEELSERVYEVEEGLKYVPGPGNAQIRLGPGNRFRPTEAQVRSGSLKGKARELTQSEYAGLGATKIQARVGVDIGLRTLPITGHVLKLALEAKLTEDDFAGLEPAGPGGNYTKAQVEELIAKKRAN
jgi:hypothetical protein